MAPIKSISTKSKFNAPWYDEELVRCGFKRDRLYNKYNKDCSSQNRSLFVKFRNVFRSLVSKKKANYYNELVKNETVSSAKLWRRLNPYLNPNKKVGINHIDLDGSDPYFTRQDMVNKFSKFFASILNNTAFCRLLDSFAYCDRHLQTAVELNCKLDSSPYFKYTEISDSSVSKLLASIDPDSSPGIVGIETKVFKHCHNELAPHLARLFNACVKSGTIPNEWKIAYITPNFKTKVTKIFVF